MGSDDVSSQVSIVMPVFRQADHIEPTVREYVLALAKLPMPSEIILVVNGADEDSWSACSALEAALPGVRALRISDSGWGRAVKVGLEHAKGDVLCFTNSARTHPADLARAIELALRNPDVVVKAQRRIRDQWQRRLASVVFNFYCRALFDLPFWDMNGTPKAFSRRFSSLLQLAEDGDLLDLEFLIACQDAGYLVLEVPVRHAARRGGRSTTSYASAYHLFSGATRLWRRRSAVKRQ